MALTTSTKQTSVPQQEAELEDERVLLTVDEAAHRLGIGRSHAYIFVMKGQLESVKIGKSRRVPATAIGDFVARLRSGQIEG